MTGMSALERRYRRLLAWYPAEHRLSGLAMLLYPIAFWRMPAGASVLAFTAVALAPQGWTSQAG